MSEIDQLAALRKSLFNLQQKFLVLLCGDDEEEDTPLQKSFAFLIWEVDERTREIIKMSKL